MPFFAELCLTSLSRAGVVQVRVDYAALIHTLVITPSPPMLTPPPMPPMLCIDFRRYAIIYFAAAFAFAIDKMLRHCC